MATRRWGFAWVVALALGCGGLALPGGEPRDDGWADAATATITASEGGSVQLADGTHLDIPPGALPSDTEITVRRAISGPGDGPLAAIVLEPHNLKLSIPATLTVPFDTARVRPADRVGAEVADAASPPVEVGGEQSVWKPAKVEVEGNVARIEVPHFSLWHLFTYPWMIPALDLPPKYLRSGDILYALTSSAKFIDASSFPIHVGVFYEKGTEGQVLESTGPDKDCTDDFIYGVAQHGWEQYRTLCGHHIFIGARRPFGASKEDGRVAAAAARSQIGLHYGLLGVIPPGGVTCVELAEDAWEDAGFNITLIPDTILTPWDQYLRTEPVRRLEVTAGSTVQLGVIAAIRNDNQYYDAAGRNPPFRKNVRLELIAGDETSPTGRLKVEDVTKNVADSPDFATITFQPTDDDVDRGVYTYDARFTELSSGEVMYVRDFLELHVVPPAPCPWRTDIGDYKFTGTWKGAARGIPFGNPDAFVEIRRFGSGPGDYVLNVWSTDGDGGSNDHGEYQLDNASPPIDRLGAGSHNVWGTDERAGSGPPPVGARASAACEVGGEIGVSVGPISESTLTLDIADDCKAVDVRAHAYFPAQKTDWTSFDTPECVYEATFHGTLASAAPK
jgi:hypothetical protein